MKFAIVPLFLPIVYIACLMIISGVDIQQNIYRKDIERNGSIFDIIERLFTHIIDAIYSKRVYQTTVCTIIGAIFFTIPLFTVKSEPVIVAEANGANTSSASGIQEEGIKGVTEIEEPVVEPDLTEVNAITEPTKEEIKTVEDVKLEEEKKQKAEEEAEEEAKKAEEEAKKESAWKEIPLCDKVSPSKTYMDDVKITAITSQQWKFFNEAKWGEVITDDLGFQYVNGVDPDTEEDMKFYTVALGSYYQNGVGEKFRVTMENGFVFGAIIGDVKSDAHTHDGSESSKLYESMSEEEVAKNNPNRCLAGSNDMLEFIIDASVGYQNYPGRNGLVNNGSMNRNFDEEHMFEGKIVKIEKLIESES